MFNKILHSKLKIWQHEVFNQNTGIRAWRYQRGINQNSYIEEEHTTQWSKEQTTIYKTKDLATRTPLKTEGELRYRNAN